MRCCPHPFPPTECRFLVGLGPIERGYFAGVLKSKGFLKLGRRTWKRVTRNSVRNRSEKRKVWALGFCGDVKLTSPLVREITHRFLRSFSEVCTQHFRPIASLELQVNTRATQRVPVYRYTVCSGFCGRGTGMLGGERTGGDSDIEHGQNRASWSPGRRHVQTITSCQRERYNYANS